MLTPRTFATVIFLTDRLFGALGSTLSSILGKRSTTLLLLGSAALLGAALIPCFFGYEHPGGWARSYSAAIAIVGLLRMKFCGIHPVKTAGSRGITVCEWQVG